MGCHVCPTAASQGLFSSYKSSGNWEDNRTLEQHPAWHLRLRWEDPSREFMPCPLKHPGPPAP